MRFLQRAAVVAAAGSLLLTTAAVSRAADPQAESFLREAALGGMSEVDLGQLAVEHGGHADVKAFGKRMVDDHAKANVELKTLAGRKSIVLPDALDAEHRALRDRLAALSGTEFDIAYMNAMTKDHEEDVDAFKKASRSPDADVAAFASHTLPTLEEHLKESRRVGSELGSARTGDVMPAKAK